MPSQPTSPSTAPAAAAPLAQLSWFLWKPPPFTDVDPLHSQLARRSAGVTRHPFYALQPIVKRALSSLSTCTMPSYPRRMG
jgi:hypothetical protein